MLSGRKAASLVAFAMLMTACGEQSDNSSASAPSAAATPAPQAAPAPAAAPPANDNAAVEAAVREMFAPYLAADRSAPSAMDRTIYTSELTAMIAAWRRATAAAGMTDLGSADWLCSCQDWDPAGARLTIDAVSRNADGRYTVAASFYPGFEGGVPMSDFILKQENGRWLIDDIGFSGESPTLRELLAEETRTGGG
jgi:hypothetical protein